MESNLRRFESTALQAAPFDHFGTTPKLTIHKTYSIKSTNFLIVARLRLEPKPLRYEPNNLPLIYPTIFKFMMTYTLTSVEVTGLEPVSIKCKLIILTIELYPLLFTLYIFDKFTKFCTAYTKNKQFTY